MKGFCQAQWLAFRTALQFLTCIPVGRMEKGSARQRAGSLLWYPVVGLIIGLTVSLSLAGADALSMPSAVTAAAGLSLWVGLTGALHLDGLADSADAWAGGRGDSQRTLVIMKDPHVGTMAVVAIVLMLLMKFVVFDVLAERDHWQTLWIVPVMARTALLAAFLFVPYVSKAGLGSDIADHLPHKEVRLVLVVTSVVSVWLLPDETGILLMIVATGVFLVWRSACMAWLGGFTGDCAGALVELLEVALLIVLALSR